MINNNGNIKQDNVYELNGMLMNTKKLGSYIPTKNLVNSCLSLDNIGNFEEGKQYYIELIVEWSGFKTNVASNFATWAQGATYNGSSWDWNATNPLTKVIGTLTSIVLSTDSGMKKISGFFTATSRKKYSLGIRTDYSNGIGKIGFSDIKVVPAQYAISNSSQFHIGNDYISTNEIIEY